MRSFLCLLTMGLMALPAYASIVVDGSQDASYGAALAVQDTSTGFGDNELNAAFAQLSGSGDVHLLLTGNLNTSYSTYSTTYKTWASIRST